MTCDSNKKIHSENDIKESKHFCMAPWVHMYILPDLKVLPCCVTSHEDSYGQAGEKSLLEAWNSEKFKDMRKKLLNDESVYSCDYCYTLEKNGSESMRKRLNSKFSHHLDFVKSTSDEGKLNKFKLNYLDFRFSNFCNFKCRGCSPTLSTSWYEDHENLWDFKSDLPKVVNKINDYPDIWEEVKNQFENLEIAYFAGGEPLMMEEHYLCLKHFIENNQVNIELNYNTNLSVLKYKKYDLIEMWSKFKKIKLMISVDDIETRGEYFRSGLVWQKLVSNIETIRNELPHVEVSINCTISLFNIGRIPLIHNFFYSRGFVDEMGFLFNTLLTPECYRSQVLPENMKKKISFKAQMYMKSLSQLYPGRDWSYFISSYQNEIDFMNQDIDQKFIDDFKQRTIKLDKIRGEDFKEVYPELRSMLD